jgi:hypothetical protein
MSTLATMMTQFALTWGPLTEPTKLTQFIEELGAVVGQADREAREQARGRPDERRLDDADILDGTVADVRSPLPGQPRPWPETATSRLTRVEAERVRLRRADDDE